MTSLYFTIRSTVLFCFICADGDTIKSIEARDTNICTFRGEVCFFTDAVGLYTVRLPWSINVNQHSFSEREKYMVWLQQRPLRISRTLDASFKMMQQVSNDTLLGIL